MSAWSVGGACRVMVAACAAPLLACTGHRRSMAGPLQKAVARCRPSGGAPSGARMGMPNCVVVAVVVGLSGCATVIRGTTQSIVVVTDPPGAQCHVAAAAGRAPVLHDTPGSITVNRGSDVVVTCRKDGHFDTRTLLIAGERESMAREYLEEAKSLSADEAKAAEVGTATAATAAVMVGTPALVSAAMFSPAVAVAAPLLVVAAIAAPATMLVDAGSGANSAYQPSLMLMLMPASFPDAGARDAYLARYATALDADDERLRARGTATCGLYCRRLMRGLEGFIAARREDFTRDRALVSVVSP